MHINQLKTKVSIQLYHLLIELFDNVTAEDVTHISAYIYICYSLITSSPKVQLQFQIHTHRRETIRGKIGMRATLMFCFIHNHSILLVHQ